jgi:tryptophan 2,3-dioxygenase
MNTLPHSPEVSTLIDQLTQKYKAKGQSVTCHLEGLLHSDFLKYWEYINLDALLSMQHMKTDFPDEMVFITFHQICELQFKLILWEMDQIIEMGAGDAERFIQKVERINRYYESLIRSMSIMYEGIERQQFAKFRTALFPASGFQSFQYRLIQIYATDLPNLVHFREREKLGDDEELPKLYQKLYWNLGVDSNSNQPVDSTLLNFQAKYAKLLYGKARELQEKNLNRIFHKYYSCGPDRDAAAESLKKMDVAVNVTWPTMHYCSAVKHLQKEGYEASNATGGTNWQKYLMPRYQKIIFFPELWTGPEKENWGARPVLHEAEKAYH